MSLEFWEAMEKLEKKIRSIKFLENSHPEIGTLHTENAKRLLDLTEKLENAISVQLKEKAKNVRTSGPRSKRKTKI
jgi:hypothetical protein